MRYSILSLCLAVLSFAAPEAAAQQALHFYELGVEVNGSRVNLAISDAATGRSLYSGLISETRASPDIQFDTNGQGGGPGIIILPPGVLLLSFTPASCTGVPNCTPLSVGNTYAWAGNSTPIPVGTFYHPASTGRIDTDFKIVSGRLNVHTNDSGIAGDINTFLGHRWTLPYDRTTLCALTPCNGGGPTGQFFSAGVPTQAPLPGYTGRRLVPTFSFAGSVGLPDAWGAQAWAVQGLQLQFELGARLSTASGLSITGATLTQSAAEEGWAGVHVGGGTTLLDGTRVTSVSYDDGSHYKRANSAVTVSGGATLTLRNGAEVSGAKLAQGIEVVGATVVIEGPTTKVQGNAYAGVVAMPGARVTIRDGAQITGNLGGGVAAWGTDAVVNLDHAQVLSNEGVGVMASGGGLVQTVSAGTATLRTSVSQNHGGLDASEAGSIQMGAFSTKTGACMNCDHVLLNNTTNPDPLGVPFFDATAFGSSLVRAQGNDWGVGTVSQLRLAQDGSSTLLVCPFAGQPGGCGTVAVAAGRGTGSEDDLSAERLDAPSGTVAARGGASAALDAVVEAEDALLDGDAAEAATLIAWALGEAATDDERAGVYGGATRVLAQIQPAALVEDIAARTAGTDRPWALRALTVALAGDASAAAGHASALAAEYAGTEHGAVGLGWLARLAAGDGDEAGALGHLVTLWDAAPTSGAFAESAAVVAAAFPDADLGWIPSARGTVAGKTDEGAEARLAVWPNPTSGAARLSVPSAAGETLSVDVYDGLGRRVIVVADGAISSGAAFEASLPTADLPPGVYLVRVVRRGAGGAAAVSVARLTVAR